MSRPEPCELSSNAGYVRGCRCHGCHQAHLAYNERRRKRMGYGVWRPFVDAEPVRQHIAMLQGHGIGVKRLAALSGVPRSVLGRIMWAIGTRGRTKRVRLATANAVLAIRPDAAARHPETVIDGSGTRRRLQALAVMQWSAGLLGERLGVSDTRVQQLQRAETVEVRTWMRVRALYDELCMEFGPSKVSRSRAVVHGWVPPLAWDEGAIDDPTAVPHVPEPAANGVGRPVDHSVDHVAVYLACSGQRHWQSLTAGEKTAAIQQLAERGMNNSDIGARLHANPKAVAKWRRRECVASGLREAS